MSKINQRVTKWFQSMLSNEMLDTEGTISNERLWLKGSDNEESMFCHESNIVSLEEYKSVLNSLDRHISSGDVSIDVSHADECIVEWLNQFLDTCVHWADCQIEEFSGSMVGSMGEDLCDYRKLVDSLRNDIRKAA